MIQFDNAIVVPKIINIPNSLKTLKKADTYNVKSD
jgi:hypothetical protein